MNKKLKKYELLGIIFTILMGIILHFTYTWSGSNSFVALFSAVNESTWEHLKLLFFPYILYAIFEYFTIGKHYPDFATAKLFGAIIGIITIPVLFYLYKIILGHDYLAVDILIFILSVIIAYSVSYFVLKYLSLNLHYVSIILILFMIILFFIFTCSPPKIFLFEDPTSQLYGIDNLLILHYK